MRLPLSVLALAVACGARERDCADGLDDDGDGWTDCADQDCAADCGEACDNAVDDDADGLVDCADPDCGGTCTATPLGDEDCANGVD
ncbi:MAG: hypothetical protein ABMB14_06735, partial [Myxococcota bacterium]